MKKLLIIGLMLYSYIYSSGQVQQTTTPPALPPIPAGPDKMMPGMTEIWNPEVKIIQPGAVNSDAPSDAIILFDGSDINKEWIGMDGKPSIWTVKDGAFSMIFSCMLSGKRHLRFRETAREGAIAEFFSRNFMKYRYSIAMITERIATDKPEQCINNMLHW